MLNDFPLFLQAKPTKLGENAFYSGKRVRNGTLANRCMFDFQSRLPGFGGRRQEAHPQAGATGSRLRQTARMAAMASASGRGTSMRQSSRPGRSIAGAAPNPTDRLGRKEKVWSNVPCRLLTYLPREGVRGGMRSLGRSFVLSLQRTKNI